VALPRLGGEVRIQELGEGPPVLFVHGGSTCGTSWAELAAALPRFRCLLLDRPGTGLSDPLVRPVRDLGDLVDLADALLLDVLDGLGLPTAPVVATSFGGYFAMRAALAAPGRIERLVLLGWNAGAPVSRLPMMLRLGVAPVIGELLARMPVNRAAVRAIFRGIGSGAAVRDGRISAPAIDAYVELLRRTPSVRNDLALGRLLFSAGQGLDPRFLLSAEERARIATPTAFLWGDRDAFGDAAIARAFVAPFPDARLEIVPGAGHAIWVDDLDRAARFVGAAFAPPSVSGGATR
jgi:pimeloyl-ACP methyl ester carboxylesterase